MINPKSLFVAIALNLSAIFLGLIVVIGIGKSFDNLRKVNESMNQSQSSELSGLGATSSFPVPDFRGSTSEEGNDLGAISYLGRDVINWRSESHVGSQFGATPLDVLKAASRRMQHLQSTAQASNSTAKALFAVEQAIQSLEGKDPFDFTSSSNLPTKESPDNE
jgi:hypothetical protein